MKQIIVVTAALLLAGAVKVNAQEKTSTDKKDGVHIGVRAGVNLSNLIQDNNANTTTGSKLGLNAAVFLELPITDGFSVQPELQFSQKGYKETGSFLGSPYEYHKTTNFIEVPLLAKFKPTKNFGILIGPQFSFLASTQTKFTVNNSTFENEVKQDNDNLRKNILGGVVGIEASSGPVVFDLRYNLDFQNNNGDGTSSTPKYKNQVIALSVGFRF